MADPKQMSDNPLSISWHDSAWIPVLTPHNVMDYFSESSNPFYDRTCNNEVIKMQRGLSLDQLQSMQGIEYTLLHVQEPILYVVRKQNRLSPSQVTPITDYYIIAGIVYQAPDLASVINSRLLSSVSHLQSAFEEARNYAKYHPSTGYRWDFESAPSIILGKGRSKTSASDLGKSSRKGKKRSKKREAERKVKEEPSSLFQRRRVDMILDLITRKFPPRVAPPVQPQAPAQTEVKEAPPSGESANKAESKDNVKNEPKPIDGAGVKREAPGSKGMPEAKRVKVA